MTMKRASDFRAGRIHQYSIDAILHCIYCTWVEEYTKLSHLPRAMLMYSLFEALTWAMNIVSFLDFP